ncbi:MAG TPA: TIGR03435 family protein [Bryobacteraceae bacterium]|nr:TIGR03435 family protein [Bryobacteraceae bacterium]
MIREVACAILCASGLAFGQSEASLRFEVASIKPSNADPSSSGVHSGNGRLTAENVTLKRCIMAAYGIGPNQILGGPDWLDSDRFDIDAKGERPDADVMTMLRSLMAERFKLALHRETKPIQAYVLEVAKNGPKMERTDGESHQTSNGRGDIVARNASMDRFAEVLSRQMDLPVVNLTGLEGTFNFRLQWTPENSRTAKAGESAALERLDKPSVFTAVQEQLGLRLRAQKAPVQVLVIDHAERPAEN